MNIEKKLDVWTKEKLITGAQKKAVLEYEERLKSRSLLYTLLFLGGFCFGLGIISLIAYNWQDISPAAKLVIYFVMLAATGGAAVSASFRQPSAFVRNASFCVCPVGFGRHRPDRTDISAYRSWFAGVVVLGGCRFAAAAFCASCLAAFSLAAGFCGFSV